jgi:hypothetical protein
VITNQLLSETWTFFARFLSGNFVITNHLFKEQSHEIFGICFLFGNSVIDVCVFTRSLYFVFTMGLDFSLNHCALTSFLLTEFDLFKIVIEFGTQMYPNPFRTQIVLKK